MKDPELTDTVIVSSGSLCAAVVDTSIAQVMSSNNEKSLLAGRHAAAPESINYFSES